MERHPIRARQRDLLSVRGRLAQAVAETDELAKVRAVMGEGQDKVLGAADGRRLGQARAYRALEVPR